MRKITKHYIFFAVILFVIFLFRFPSHFEPFWYGDEGIFAAVASNLNQGGILYQDSWDNKPPMIYLTYAAIFKFLGVSMFWLHLVATCAVLVCAAVIYEISQKILGNTRALVATLVFGILVSLRIVEGNLALTEIFMILFTSSAMLIATRRNFDVVSLFTSGVLLGIASQFKQVGALEAAALGIFLFFVSRNLMEFLKKGFVLVIGFLTPIAVIVLYFASRGLVGEYIFASYTYYRIYFGESPRYAVLINVLKYLPIVTAIGYGLFKMHRKTKVALIHLILLWCAFSFLGSYFSGRAYGHYLVQAIPAVSILLAAITIKLKFKTVQVIFALFFFVPIIFLTKLLFVDFLTGGPLSQVHYWQNFVGLVSGKKTIDEYNNYFDRNVTMILSLRDFFAGRGEVSPSVYIWGDFSWLYAIGDFHNPTRYVTSFHVFGVPGGKEEVASDLTAAPPNYIIRSSHSIGYFDSLESILASNYTFIFKVGNNDIFAKKDLLKQ